MLCEGKESRGWATDVAAQSGRKAAIILNNIAAQCMGQPVLSQPLKVRQSAFSLIRKDKKKLLNYFLPRKSGFMDCGRNQKRRRKRSENAAFFNCLNFKIHRDFLNLLTLSNVVELSWS